MSVSGPPTSSSHAPQASQPQQAPQAQPQVPQQQKPHPPAPTEQQAQTEVSDNANTDYGSQDIQMQQNPQAGMMVVPSQQVDMSSMDMTGGGWNSGIDISYASTPVFAVLDVPEGPAIDTGALSQKTSHSVVDSCMPNGKDEVPCLEHPPVIEEPENERDNGVVDSGVELDESFSLFIDSPSSTSSPPCKTPDEHSDVQGEKAGMTFKLVVEDDPKEASAAAMKRFERLCLSMEPAFQRVSMATSHLV